LLLAGKGSRPQGTSAAKEASANKDSLRRAAPDSSGRPPAKKQRVALTVGRAIQAAQEQDLAEVSVRDSSRFSINVRFGSLPSYRAFLDGRYYVPKSMQEAQALFDTLDDMFNTMPEQAAPETNSNESDDEDD
jgi:hypothetical protein